MQRILRSSSIKVAPPQEVKVETKIESKSEKTSQTDDWKLYRQIAKTEAPHKPRTSSTYADNISASLALPFSFYQLQEKKDDFTELLNMSEKHILEHAARRVDLFFYTLIAYYKTEVQPIEGWTRLQHGKGKVEFATHKVLTHAAHSSITTALLDKNITKKIPLESEIKASNLKIKTSQICATHFMDSLNSTIELPVFVNEFDFELEFIKGGRDKSFKILREVAQGYMNPIEGLLTFILMLNSIFNKMLESTEVFKTKISMPKDIKIKLVELVKKGTLINKLGKDERSVNDEYIFMLLRLDMFQIKACKKNVKTYEKMLEAKMLSIQKEILENKSSHVKSL